MDPNNFSSEYIENKMVTLNFETLSFEDFFETKIQAKFDKPDKILDNQKNNLWI